MITPTQSFVAEIPEVLREALQDYLNQHPDWDQSRVLTAALALFLLQNGDGSDRRASKVYLEALFRPAGGGTTETPDPLETQAEVQGEPVSEGAIAPDPSTVPEAPETPRVAEVVASSPHPSATPTTA